MIQIKILILKEGSKLFYHLSQYSKFLESIKINNNK